MGEIFCNAMPRIRVALRENDVPIIATVSADAAVTLIVSGGKSLEPRRTVRLPRRRRGAPS